MTYLDAPIENAISDVLYDYCCGNATASDVHTTLKYLGFRVDLRTWINNTIEVSNKSGTKHYMIEV